MRRCSVLFASLLLLSALAFAQDLFEIQVYPYDTVAPHHTMFEFHMNFYPSGTPPEDDLYAVNDQFHLTMEVTHCLSRYRELGGYLVTAYVPDVGPKFAGTRIRARFRHHWVVKWIIGRRFSF